MNYQATSNWISRLSEFSLLASAMLISSCALPTGRVQFDPYPEDGAVPVHVPANPGSASAGGSGPTVDFYEFRRRDAPPSSLLKPDGDPYLLGAGDRLFIEVVEAPETRAQAIVMPDGMLYYDVADGVMAAGRTLEQLEAALARQLETEYAFPMVTASLMTPASRSYTILGQVQKPGSYALTKPTSLLAAIAEAGGSGGIGDGRALADLPRSVVIRNGKVLPVDFSALVENGDMRHNIQLQPGDYVSMPAEGKDRVYVLGAVKVPAAIPYSSRITLVAALASVRGLAEEAFPQGALVVRGSFTNPRFAPVNLNEIIRGRQPNFTLLPGDIIWVPAKPWQKLSQYAKFGIAAAASSYALRESSWIFADEKEFAPSAATSRANSTPNTTSASAPSPAPAPTTTGASPGIPVTGTTGAPAISTTGI